MFVLCARLVFVLFSGDLLSEQVVLIHGRRVSVGTVFAQHDCGELGPVHGPLDGGPGEPIPGEEVVDLILWKSPALKHFFRSLNDPPILFQNVILIRHPGGDVSARADMLERLSGERREMAISVNCEMELLADGAPLILGDGHNALGRVDGMPVEG